MGHPGCGELLFLRYIWPDVPQPHFLEFHYAARGLDVGFDPEFPAGGWRDAARVTAKAGPSLLNLEVMAAGISPTHLQASTYPSWAQKRITVIHDGIDTRVATLNPGWIRPGRGGAGSPPAASTAPPNGTGPCCTVLQPSGSFSDAGTTSPCIRQDFLQLQRVTTSMPSSSEIRGAL